MAILKHMRKKMRQAQRPRGQYTHEPLPQAGQRQYIRLLTLTPSRSSVTPLEGSLQPHALDEVDCKYEAVSYEWRRPGKEGFSEAIILDGKSLMITENLFECLLRLRSNSLGALWIDAICINQADLEERTSQVAVMGRIYSSAIRTLSWLGELDTAFARETAEMTFSLLRKEAERPVSLSSHDAPKINANVESQEVATTQRSTGLSGVDQSNIAQFLLNSYFRRRWIVQEIALARNVQLIWGHLSIAWSDVLLVDERLNFRSMAPRPVGPIAHRQLHCCSPSAGHSNVLQLMRAFYWSGCENPLDQIAALQGLWRGHEGCSTVFSVDYTQSVESNYLRFAKLLALTADCGQLLLCAIRSANRSDASTLPSWVPDWREWTFLHLEDYPDSMDLAYDAQLSSTSALILRGWILNEIRIVNVFKEPFKNEEFLAILDDLSERYAHRHYGKPRQGDKICTFSHGAVLKVHQFVIRETVSGSGRYKLITLCHLSKAERTEYGEGSQRTYESEPVEIVLV